MPTFLPTTVVLVDPTSPDGETSLHLLHHDDAHVLVVVLTSGRSSTALHEFAREEGVSVSSAAWTYLDQVAARIERAGRIVGTIAATGPDTAYEIAVVASEHDVRRVVLPASIARVDRSLARRLAHLVPASIELPTAVGV